MPGTGMGTGLAAGERPGLPGHHQRALEELKAKLRANAPAAILAVAEDDDSRS